MCRRLIASALAVALGAVAGCSADEDAGGPEPRASTESSSTQTAAQPSEPPDPLATTRVDELPGRITELVRDQAGHTLAFGSRSSSETTYYRIYGPGWRPLSPLLRVETWWDDFSIEPTARGFLVRASHRRSRQAPRFRGWIRIDPRGRLHPAAAPPDVPGVGRQDLVTEHAEGSLCAVRHRTPTGGEVRSTTDGGRSWQTTATTVTAGAGPRIWSCAVGHGRVVVLTGGSEYAGQLQTYDRASGVVLGTLEVGDGTPVDPYTWFVLPDGALVADTDQPGIVVATDTTNTAVQHHGGVAAAGWITVLDDQIVLVRGDRRIAVSDDHGQTWRLVDLGLAAGP